LGLIFRKKDFIEVVSEPKGGLINGKTACKSCMGAAMANFKAIFEAAAA
jgi:hypothetical protein